MFAALLIAEVAFWGCLFLGLLARYTFKKPQLGLWLLAMTPAIDLLLLIYAAYDLHKSGQADFFHGFSAFYVVFSVVFGRDLIVKMDSWFAGVKNNPGQTASLGKCVLASAITAIVLAGLIVITGKAGSFWLLYWLIAVAFTPVMWWGLDRWNARRGSK